MSLDGYIDDTTDTRLVLSGTADLDRVDALRARSDAVLVGGGTIRADNPRLLLHSQARRQARITRGDIPDPVRVILASSGELDPAARIFTSGEPTRLVYVSTASLTRTAARLAGTAEVVDGGEPVSLPGVLADLACRGIRRLMVEGGSSVLTGFLQAGLADELQLAIAPFLVGDSRAPRFASDGTFPYNSGHPARLVNVDRAGQDVVATYALSDRYSTS